MASIMAKKSRSRAQRINAGYDKIWDTAQRLSNAQREMDKHRPARKPQQPCDIGLFSDEADQLDLVSWFTEQTEE
jgi:hypothetical protein